MEFIDLKSYCAYCTVSQSYCVGRQSLAKRVFSLEWYSLLVVYGKLNMKVQKSTWMRLKNACCTRENSERPRLQSSCCLLVRLDLHVFCIWLSSDTAVFLRQMSHEMIMPRHHSKFSLSLQVGVYFMIWATSFQCFTVWGWILLFIVVQVTVEKLKVEWRCL